MLENYFEKPTTIDRIRGSWIGTEIERYVGWLAEHGYRPVVVVRRVPLLTGFGEFARRRGARAVEDLPAHVDAFVGVRVDARRGPGHRGATNRRLAEIAKEVRGPIEQMLEVVLPGYEGSGRRHLADPFVEVMPLFFEYLVAERGLRAATLDHYRHHLHASRPISRASASAASTSSRPRCSARSSPNGPPRASRKRASGIPAACCGCSSATRTVRA
jgi:integrase/recombinase XerD